MRQDSKYSRNKRKGFALVVALGLMSFIILLLLTTSVVVSLDVATLQQKSHLEEARDNAKLGLLIALGELQKETGPDQRITATASIVSASSGSSLNHPQWVGVWDSAAWDSIDPDGQPNTAGLFRKWLVSVPEGSDPQSLTLPTSAANNDWVKLVDKGTLGSGAPSTDIVYGGRNVMPDGGHFAYWVGDEGVKARYNLPGAASPYGALPAQAFNLAAPTHWGIEAIDDDDDPDSASVFSAIFDSAPPPRVGDIELSSEVEMVTSAGVSADALRDAYGKRFHDLSLSSMGLLTNARDGGLKQDLSLAFEMSDTDFNKHADFAVGDADWNTLYTDTNTDGQPVKHLWMYDSEDVDPNATNTYYKGPTWHLLRDYYRLYREISSPTGSPTLTARNALPLADGNRQGRSIPALYDDGQKVYNTGKSGSRDLPRPRTLKVAPVVARVQLLLSLTTVPVGSPAISPSPPRLVGQDVYKLRLIVDPIITLYNPYSVNLWFQGVTINIPKIAGSLRWEINGVESNLLSLLEIIGLSHPAYGGHSERNMGAIKGFGTLAIGAPGGITLAPGEVRIYSAGNEKPVSFKTTGTDVVELDAVEGWLTGGGFYVDTLDPDPSQRDPDWISDINKKDYYQNALSNGETDVVLGLAGDSIVVNFEAVPVESGESFIWVSRGTGADPVTGKKEYTNIKNKDKQMSVDAYLVTSGAYDNRFKIHGNDANTFGGLIHHYTRLRTNMEFGPSDLIGNIGRVPEAPGAYTFGFLDGYKQTLGQIDIRLKTEDDQVRPYPMFAFSSMNAFATNRQSAADGDYGQITPPFAIVREPLDDVTNALQFNPDTLRGFWGPTRISGSGATSFVAGTDIPKAPLVSMGQLQHVDTAIYGYESSHAIGNSFATPWIELDKVELADKANIDTSFLANNALWDGYYFSSITSQDTSIFGSQQRTLETVLDQFTGPEPVLLPNPRMAFLGGSTEIVQEFKDSVMASGNQVDPDGHRKSAAYLGVTGAFNVNSTSVEAWKALYASLGSGRLVKLSPDGTFSSGGNTDEIRISRFSVPLGDPGDKWAGYSTLSADDIDRLAVETVKQVKKRGPFLSMAQFVNRQISTDPDVAKAGALQTAINDANVNTDSPGIIDSEIVGYIVSDNAKVPVDTGAVGFLTQADLLSLLGPFLSVRSDTFTIRAYGDSVNPITEKITARAWCEAIVQRIPGYVDDIDDAITLPYDASGNDNLSKANQAFGRQYKIISFRWLGEGEV